jgi:hypothetical protein
MQLIITIRGLGAAPVQARRARAGVRRLIAGAGGGGGLRTGGGGPAGAEADAAGSKKFSGRPDRFASVRGCDGASGQDRQRPGTDSQG